MICSSVILQFLNFMIFFFFLMCMTGSSLFSWWSGKNICIRMKIRLCHLKPDQKKNLWFELKRHVLCHGVWCVCGHGALPLTPCAYCSRNSLSLDDIRWVYSISVLIQPVPDWAVLLHADPNAIFRWLVWLVNMMLPLLKKKKSQHSRAHAIRASSWWALAEDVIMAQHFDGNSAPVCV